MESLHSLHECLARGTEMWGSHGLGRPLIVAHEADPLIVQSGCLFSYLCIGRRVFYESFAEQHRECEQSDIRCWSSIVCRYLIVRLVHGSSSVKTSGDRSRSQAGGSSRVMESTPGRLPRTCLVHSDLRVNPQLYRASFTKHVGKESYRATA